MQKEQKKVTLKLSKDFKKPLPLPNMREWKVFDSDCLLSDSLDCYLKSKGLVFNYETTANYRYISITRNGVMMVYEKDSCGFVVSLDQAKSIETTTKKVKVGKGEQRKCMIKIKFDFGTINLTITKRLSEWRRVISDFYDKKSCPCSTMTATETLPLSTSTGNNGTSQSTTVKESDSKTSSTLKQSESMITLTTSFTYVPPLDLQALLEQRELSTLVKNKPLPPYVPLKRQMEVSTKKVQLSCPRISLNDATLTEFTRSGINPNLQSVRQGAHSVASIRERLERSASQSSNRPKNTHVLRKTKSEPNSVLEPPPLPKSRQPSLRRSSSLHKPIKTQVKQSVEDPVFFNFSSSQRRIQIRG